MSRQPAEKAAPRIRPHGLDRKWSAASRPRPDPRVHERAHQPRPSRTVVIRPVTRLGGPGARIDVAWLSTRKRPKPHRGPQLPLRQLHHTRRPLTGEEGDSKPTNGHDLVWPKPVVGATRFVIDVDDVVEAAPARIPEAFGKALRRLVAEITPPLVPPRADDQRVHPERLNLDGLA